MQTQKTRGSRRRTVEEFPRMNDRAGRRRHRRAQRAALRKLPTIMDVLRRAGRVLADAFAALGRAAIALGEAAAHVVGAVFDVFRDAQRRAAQWRARPVPDGGRWVLRALPADSIRSTAGLHVGQLS